MSSEKFIELLNQKKKKRYSYETGEAKEEMVLLHWNKKYEYKLQLSKEIWLPCIKASMIGPQAIFLQTVDYSSWEWLPPSFTDSRLILRISAQ